MPLTSYLLVPKLGLISEGTYPDRGATAKVDSIRLVVSIECFRVDLKDSNVTDLPRVWTPGSGREDGSGVSWVPGQYSARLLRDISCVGCRECAGAFG